MHWWAKSTGCHDHSDYVILNIFHIFIISLLEKVDDIYDLYGVPSEGKTTIYGKWVYYRINFLYQNFCPLFLAKNGKCHNIWKCPFLSHDWGYMLDATKYGLIYFGLILTQKIGWISKIRHFLVIFAHSDRQYSYFC